MSEPREPVLHEEYAIAWDGGGAGETRRVRAGEYPSYARADEALRNTLSIGMGKRLRVRIERRVVSDWEQVDGDDE